MINPLSLMESQDELMMQLGRVRPVAEGLQGAKNLGQLESWVQAVAGLNFNNHRHHHYHYDHHHDHHQDHHHQYHHRHHHGHHNHDHPHHHDHHHHHHHFHHYHYHHHHKKFNQVPAAPRFARRGGGGPRDTPNGARTQPW